jgi:hypothetical protein
MSRLLKKLTRRLMAVIGTMLPLILAAPAMAQWGAVTSKADSNRFINSQQDFGLIMPHQQVIVGLLDTTISSVGIRGGNASKVIVGSLLDHEDNCANYNIVNGVASCEGSYELWREMEKSTSYYQAARGDTTAMFPTNYAITVSTGNDSVKIWNRDTAETWMALREAASVILGDGAINDIAFKDMILYVATATQIYLIDFAADKAHRHGVSGRALYLSNIHGREGADYTSPSISTLAIKNDAVNSVAVVRDPFGLKDALGRPKHWWLAGTAGGNSIYNPHTNAIYDSGDTQPQIDVAAIKGGSFFWTSSDPTRDDMAFYYSAFSRTADGWSPGGTAPVGDQYDNNQSGGNDLAWTNSAVFSGLAAIEDGAIVGREAPLVIIGSDEGLYNIHTYPQNPTVGARQRFSSTVNAPVEFGNGVLALAFENNTTDSSPYGSTMSVNGTMGTVTAVFGNGGSFTLGGSIEHAGVAGLTGVGWGVSGGNYAMGWFKRANIATRAGETIIDISNNGSDPQFVVEATSTNQTFRIRYHNGSATDDITSVDFCDGEWHHLAFIRNVDDGAQLFYLDGVLSGSDYSLIGAGATTNDDIMFGANGTTGGGTNAFAAMQLDDWSVGLGKVSAEAIAKIYAEGRKKLGMGSPISTRQTDDALISNNVVELDALDNGVWAVAFSDANTVQVFDGRIPLQQIAAPAGTVKSVALIQSPGTDSVGVAISTNTNLKFVQPAVNLRAAMAHQYKEPIYVGEHVVVDSAGIGGIFWTGDDALDAGANANHRRIFVMDGTYGSLNLDQSRIYVECESTEALFDGGTANHGIYVTAPRSIIDGCGAMTTPGGGSAYDGIHVAATGDSTKIIGVHILDSDDLGLYWISGANVGWIFDSMIDNADDNCLQPDGLQIIVSGNQIRGCGARGIAIDAGGDVHILNNQLRGITTESIIVGDSNSDNNILIGNRTVDGTYGIRFSGSGAANNIAVGNRLSGASTSNYTDAGTNTTAAGNNTN